MSKTAMIFGATGAVGKQLLKDILKNGTYAKVISVGRRPVEIEDNTIPQDKLVQKTIDFNNLEAYRNDFKGVSDVFCCLGTTRADAGSAENFIKIDQTYVLDSARLIAEENKTDKALSPVHFLYCSASNSNKNSMFLYPKTKGETEAALEEIGFEKVSIFRPGFLETVEPRTRPRMSESIAFSIFKPINQLFNLNMVISVETVGKAMHKVAANASIKPTEEKNMKQSSIGSTIFSFSNADIEEIGHPNH
ncbi:uncharacterized protein BX663DRAFT_512738 [Cokeromyces recurvatus]|uniref:uncharacterized protein n=1 Tax=Cokeromyces recurvatus TaxID=90255 RepID=UPI002220A0E8|nr:uncharacterized protein BX663DRAFT_512738 [Cokeromyces recurvatus]KAI7901888.1 hypothetical protein BX663DRAFT_512738 [Cokeromyces recurvatus]